MISDCDGDVIDPRGAADCDPELTTDSLNQRPAYHQTYGSS